MEEMYERDGSYNKWEYPNKYNDDIANKNV